MPELILTPTDFVAVFNQTLEVAYPVVTIEGELGNFRVAKNRWVYFSLKDQNASVSFFGTVYMLPGPLVDGLMVRAVGSPRLHPNFGFAVNLQSLVPVGKGALKKAADLLFAKLEAEGLFALQRKRVLPLIPERVGLITAATSAAYSDFIKILGQRWAGVNVQVADVYVQGEQAPGQIVAAIEYFSQLADPPEVLVITRGGGSADDLASFSDERLVRAVAASRVPTLVAIGHEVDISLAELAADQKASTPSHAAQLLVPDRTQELTLMAGRRQDLARQVQLLYEVAVGKLADQKDFLGQQISNLLTAELERLLTARRITSLYNPQAALKRGYAIVTKGDKHISSVRYVHRGDKLGVQLADGTISTNVEEVQRD